MIGLVINIVLAVLVLILAAALVLQGRRQFHSEAGEDRELVRGLGDGVSLDLASRIFDAADYRLLRDEIEFPHLAEMLLRTRKDLALRWLGGLRSSFNELVRTPQSIEASACGDDAGSWAMLFLTLRFHLLVGYALCVVRLFGPYHHLVPSLAWLQALSGVRDRTAPAGVARVDSVS
jgi:hypothetical protein